jgi:hypothetical protein
LATVPPVFTGVTYQRPAAGLLITMLWFAPAPVAECEAEPRGGATATTGPAGWSMRAAYSDTEPLPLVVARVIWVTPGGTSKYRRSCAAPPASETVRAVPGLRP